MHRPADHSRRRFAIVLGTNEVASAVAVCLHRADFGVVLSHDPDPPVIRRKMAFHDALYSDAIQLDGVGAERVDTGMQLFKALRGSDKVLVSWLGLPDLLPVGAFDVLVDARLQTCRPTPDLRRLARRAIGLGPGFSTAANCDVAIETRPGRGGLIVRDGRTDAADGAVGLLGHAGAERFVHAEANGRWHSAVDIGSRVFKGFVLGHLAGQPVRAPCDGILRGIVRDGSEITGRIKLVEIDPRGRHAQWTGIDQRGRDVAKAVIRALRGSPVSDGVMAVAQRLGG